MTLIVETGAGLPDSNSYISTDDADTYHQLRGREVEWLDLDPDVKERALVLATDYMTQEYRVFWTGRRKTITQALDWPRYEVPVIDAQAGAFNPYYATDAVPVAVAYACAELALRATTTVLAPDLVAPVLSKEVGPIKVTYAEGVRQYVRYRAIEGMLAPFLRNLGNQTNLSVVRS